MYLLKYCTAIFFVPLVESLLTKKVKKNKAPLARPCSSVIQSDEGKRRVKVPNSKVVFADPAR